ncbi:MAG: SCO family protein [Actinobacteria bacterium]|nr:MAG: SCO family protein [Actinomycetota bacterium]
MNASSIRTWTGRSSSTEPVNAWPNLARAAVAAAALTIFIPAPANGAAPAFDGPTIKNPRLAPNFTLRDQDSQTIELSHLRGKAVLLTFLYTHCPDACPLTAVRLNGALAALGPERTHVRVLAVSVDPRRDTSQAVAGFISSHHLLQQFRYLTGPRTKLAAIWRLYGISSHPAGGDKTLDHTLYTLLIDPKGRGRVLYDSTATSTIIDHDLRLILASYP